MARYGHGRWRGTIVFRARLTRERGCRPLSAAVISVFPPQDCRPTLDSGPFGRKLSWKTSFGVWVEGLTSH